MIVGVAGGGRAVLAARMCASTHGAHTPPPPRGCRLARTDIPRSGTETDHLVLVWAMRSPPAISPLPTPCVLRYVLRFCGGFLLCLADRLMSIYMSAAAFLLEEWSSCKVVTHGERVPPNVRALVIINHVSDIDGIAGLAWFARMPPPFPGCVKAIVKERYVSAAGRRTVHRVCCCSLHSHSLFVVCGRGSLGSHLFHRSRCLSGLFALALDFLLPNGSPIAALRRGCPAASAGSQYLGGCSAAGNTCSSAGTGVPTPLACPPSCTTLHRRPPPTG